MGDEYERKIVPLNFSSSISFEPDEFTDDDLVAARAFGLPLRSWMEEIDARLTDELFMGVGITAQPRQKRWHTIPDD